MRVLNTERRKLTAEDMARMNVPEGLWRTRLQWVPKSIFAALQNYCENFNVMAEKGAGLLLWGHEGVGKSGAATVVAKEARARGYTVFYTSIVELREAVRERRLFDESSSVLERCRDVDVLILDNLQESDVSEPHVNLAVVEDLLVGRGAKLKISILTTRIPFTELAARHESFVRTVSGYVVPMHVDGPDLRERRGEFLHDLVTGKK